MHFAFAYFPFVLIHLEYETINTFIRSRSSLENHIRFQTKMGQSVYTFSDQKGPKTLPFRTAHTYMAYIRDPRPPDLGVGFCVYVDGNSWKMTKEQDEPTLRVCIRKFRLKNGVEEND